MKIKLRIANCTHETRHGSDGYIGIIKKYENPDDIVDQIVKECEYDEDSDNETFECSIEEIVINTDDFEVVEE